MTIADARVGNAGHLIHSQVHVNDRFATDSVAAKYVHNLIDYALGNSTYAYVQQVDLTPVSPILSVVPCRCDVNSDESRITVEVSNVGVGRMSWTTQVIEGADWLSITSGAGGTDNGTIGVHIGQNTSSTDSRLARIRITSPGVEGSPMDVTVVQATHISIPGDANGDGRVDVGDLGILAANYGGTGKTRAQGDFNGDGVVDVGDLGILAANYGTGSSSVCDFDADYVNVFGTSAEDSTNEEDNASTFCSNLGFSLIAGLAILGLMIVKLDE
jgi:hypothetical protein